MRLIESRNSSYSTGTCVRSIGMTAPSSITGPPVYGGDSWMVRDATRLGFRIDAVALAGTLNLFS